MLYSTRGQSPLGTGKKEKLACLQVELGKRKEPEGSLPPPPRLGPQPPQPSSLPPPVMRPTPAAPQAAGAGPQSLPPPPVMAPRPQAPPQLPPPAQAPPQMRPPAFGLPLPQRPPMMAGGLPPRPMVPGMPGAAAITSAAHTCYTAACLQLTIIHTSFSLVHCQLVLLLAVKDASSAS